VVEMWLATLELDDDISKRVPLMTGAEMVYEMVYMYIYIFMIYIYRGYILGIFNLCVFFKDPYILFFIYIYGIC
jgi:hypothetical protein